MSDYIIRSNDMAIFNINFSGATVTLGGAPPVFPITGTADMLIQSIPACLEGDQASVIIPGCTYFRPPYVIPGTGIVTIKRLDPTQTTVNSTYRGRRIILRGGNFVGLFTRVVPAFQPNPSGAPFPDMTPTYDGSGMFVTSNTVVKIS